MSNDFTFPQFPVRPNPYADPGLADPAQPLPVPAPAKSRWWVRLLFWAGLFFCGVVFGSSATWMGVQKEVVRVIHRPELAVPKVTARIRQELSLNDAQTAKVEQLVRQRQLALQSLRREIQPRLETELRQFQEEVSEVLDAKQRERWKIRTEQFRKLWFPPLDENKEPAKSEK